MTAAEVAKILTDSAQLKLTIAKSARLLDEIAAVGAKLKQIVQNGGTIYVCGNGGSACDAMHFVEELVARYKRERPGIRAMHFIDGATLTCWSNDYEYESAFERQAKTFCSKNDVLIAISTSGQSKNILRACKVAKENGCFCVGLSGKDGGKLPSVCDQVIVVPGNETERIQETHITIIHAWCELLER